MVAITATNSATPTPQLALSKARVSQARQEAEQAEAKAQDLRSQADAAEMDAQKSHQRARVLATQNRPSDAPTYAEPSATDTTEVEPKTQDFLVRMYGASASKFAQAGNPLKSEPNAAPVVNTQGQKTGRIVNVSA